MILRRLLLWLRIVILWIISVALCVEFFCFLVVSATNFLLYGQLREGSRAIYDPYTIFLQEVPVRPTANNSVSANAAKNRTIWMLGGSTTRGDTDFDDRTIPSHLAKYLNLDDSDLHFTVTNYGTDSFNSLLETKYLEKLLIENPAVPNVIMFYDGANDVKYFLEHRTPYGHYGYRRLEALIEDYHHSWLGLLKPLNAAFYASFTRELLDRLNQVEFALDPTSPELAAMVALTEQRYDFVDKISKAFGAKFVLFWQPMLWIETCGVAPAVHAQEENLFTMATRFGTMRRNFSVVYDAIADRLAEKPYFVNFRTTLCSRNQVVYKPDGVHLNNAGRMNIAQGMAALLKERFF
jgi:lysophospholipase L1-like esterase